MVDAPLITTSLIIWPIGTAARWILRAEADMFFVRCLVVVILLLSPSIIALVRGHQSRWAIVAMNLSLGWLTIGWIASFIWSLTGSNHRRARAS